MRASAVVTYHAADRILEIVNKIREEADADATKWRAERQQLQDQIAALQHGSEKLPSKIETETARIEALIAEVNQKLGDPLLELSVEIRLNRERLELESYLKGLRYSLG
jgi:hypothetical protein